MYVAKVSSYTMHKLYYSYLHIKLYSRSCDLRNYDYYIIMLFKLFPTLISLPPKRSYAKIASDEIIHLYNQPYHHIKYVARFKRSIQVAY